jgi:hypothetical protein
MHGYLRGWYRYSGANGTNSRTPQKPPAEAGGKLGFKRDRKNRVRTPGPNGLSLGFSAQPGVGYDPRNGQIQGLTLPAYHRQLRSSAALVAEQPARQREDADADGGLLQAIVP